MLGTTPVSVTFAFTGTGPGTLTGVTLVEGNSSAVLATGNAVLQSDYVVNTSGSTLNMTNMASANAASDTLNFYNIWAC